MARDVPPRRRIHPTRSRDWYRHFAPVLLPVVLLGQRLISWSRRTRIARAERAVLALPGVAGVDFTFRAGFPSYDPSLSGWIVVRPTASPDEVAAVMGGAVDRVAAAGVPGLSGRLRLHFGEIPPWTGELTPDDHFTVVIGATVSGGLVAAETRHWLALREARPGVRMWLDAPPGGPGLRRSVRVPTPGADLPAELTAVFAAFEQVEPPPAVGSGLSVVVLDREQPYQHPPISFSSGHGVPPPEVLAAMRALAEMAPAEPRFANGVIVRWTDGGTTAQPYLEVGLSIDLDEFRRIPGNQINDRVAGSATERLALEHQDVLDAAGVPYRLRAAAFTNPPFLEVDRRRGDRTGGPGGPAQPKRPEV